MAMRNIIRIDEDKCNGCGLCAKACAEGAIKIINGKAKLVGETYCDGLGACIGHCPQNAITIEKREASPFDEEATKAHLERERKGRAPTGFVCPGMMTVDMRAPGVPSERAAGDISSQLSQWPVQLSLVSPHAPYFSNADLLLVADCVPFAMGDFHSRFLKGRAIVVGCPKLDDKQLYIEKVAAILTAARPRSLTVIHMEVPCCSGLTWIAEQAVARSGVNMGFDDVTIDLRGNVRSTDRCESP